MTALILLGRLSTNFIRDSSEVVRSLETTGKMERKTGSGRSRKTTEREERYLVLQCRRNRKNTASELGESIANEDGTPNVTDRTIRNRLIEAGYPARTPLKESLLNKDQRRKRLQWPKTHKDWDVERWRKVIWSDETSFSRFPRPGNVKVRRKPGEEIRGDCIVPAVKHGGGKIVVWGSFHASGVGILRRITGIMDQHQYQTILTKSSCRNSRNWGVKVRLMLSRCFSKTMTRSRGVERDSTGPFDEIS